MSANSLNDRHWKILKKSNFDDINSWTLPKSQNVQFKFISNVIKYFSNLFFFYSKFLTNQFDYLQRFVCLAFSFIANSFSVQRKFIEVNSNPVLFDEQESKMKIFWKRWHEIQIDFAKSLRNKFESHETIIDWDWRIESKTKIQKNPSKAKLFAFTMFWKSSRKI